MAVSGTLPMPKIVPQELADRFWHKIAFTGSPDTCWEWQFGLSVNGYGKFGIGNKEQGIKGTFASHRFAYYLHNGVDPKESIVQHTCDNTKCCNPYHLELGTHKTNAEDRKVKGRNANQNGLNNPINKYSEELILEIRRLYADGMKAIPIAEKYGMNPCYVREIVRKLVWKHI